MSKKQKITAVIFFAVLALFLAFVAYTMVCLTTAGRLAESGRYPEARAWYEKIHDTKRMRICDEAYNEQRYQQAAADMDSGNFDEAKELLAALGDYRNSAELEQQCDYLKAIAQANSGQYSDAIDAFQMLEGYKDSAAWLAAARERMYQQALSLTYSLELEEACSIWERLGDYEDSQSLLRRCQRVIAIKNDKSRSKLLVPENLYSAEEDVTIFNCPMGYVCVPKECDSETRAFIYFPGGREAEISVDVVAYYSMAPAPNTIGVFLHENGLSNMGKKAGEALDMLEQTAAECGVFVHELMICGSSLGAYSAIGSVICCCTDYDTPVDCALLLDTGNDWRELGLLPSAESWAAAAEAGTDFYLLESYGVGMNRQGIREMVNTGNSVTVVICADDDHEQITLDAMGMGIMGWALGDRREPFDSDNYSFVRLRQGSTYPD